MATQADKTALLQVVTRGELDSSAGRICVILKRFRFENPGAVLILLALFSTLLPASAAWEMKQAPLMTDWAQKVDPRDPLPEYPRPQMVRSNWLNLNGLWQFQPGSFDDAVPVGQTLPRDILVPFPMESAISGIKEHHPRSWYRRTFTVPANWKGQRILLHFGAVDWESEVFINGKSVGVHRGGYDPFSYDITRFLNDSGPQELIVRVYDPTDNLGVPRGKQTLSPGGIMYTSCSGIWQTVWLEPVPNTSISSLKLVPDIDNQRLGINVTIQGPSEGVTVSAVARIGSNLVSSISGPANRSLQLPVPNPKLWSPTNPFLYDLEITLSNRTAKLDSVSSYFGMRKISLGRVDGFVKMLLNDQFVFQYGPLDQGFWPDGIYTAPTDDALRADIEFTRGLGFNMIRKHIKVEPARWYYWADKLGVLVWQDMPSLNSYTAHPKPIDAPQYELELTRMVQNLWNSPAIVMWVVFNESQGQHRTQALVQKVRELDPTRLINEGSGGEHHGSGDILDWHNYPNPTCPASDTMAVVCGEFGGVGLAITNHTWAPGWGYIGATDGDDLATKFEQFSMMLCDFVQNHGLSAAVYTEITDVEIELNGFYTYDRKVCKLDLNRARAAAASPNGRYVFRQIVETSQTNAQIWRYTTSQPATNWFAPQFNDAEWKSGPGGFGTRGTPGAVVRTEWNSSDIWLRRVFNPGALTSEQLSGLILRIHHDEDVEVFLNGEQIFSGKGYTTTYLPILLGESASRLLKANADNVLAVHCHQTTGGQYIDVGIQERIVVKAPSANGVSAAPERPQASAVTNRAPLLATPFSPLPLGSVQPLGWLLKQCELQRDGLTGFAEQLYDENGPNSAWLGGKGENWERGPYYYKGLITLAHVLNDASLKQRAQKWFDWVLEHQRADGYIGPEADDDWWPRMVVTYALRDYFEATGDPRVPTVLSNYFRYMADTLPNRPLRDWGKARAADQMDVVLWLYNRNGDTNLLSLANLLRKQAYDWPGIFRSNAFALHGTDFHPKHNVNVQQALKFPVVAYELSKSASDRDALSIGLDHLMREHGLSCGINSGTEFLSGNSTIQGVELCSVVEAILSLQNAVQVIGDVAFADRLEKIAFNALPAGVSHNFKGLHYYILPNHVNAIVGHHGFNQDYDNGSLPGPYSGFPCCRFNLHWGWPKYIQNSWAATSDGGLAALAYGPTVVKTLLGDTEVKITEETHYPFEEQIRLRVALNKSSAFPLVLRIPAWCSNATITVNGQPQTGVKAGTFHRIQRTWNDGDQVVLNLPMQIETQTGPSRAVGIHRGPLVYSLQIAENWSVRKADPRALGFDEFEVRPDSPWNYALQLDPAKPSAALAFTNFAVPSNPFDPSQPSVGIIAKAKRLPEWVPGWRRVHAFEPPVSPVASDSPLETVTLVPFGSQRLRVSWFPYLGTPMPTVGSFTENFDSNWSERWTVFGGNWTAREGELSTTPGSSGGAKALAMATLFTNFTFEADVKVGSVGNAGLIFRVSKPDIGVDAYCGYYVGLNPARGQLEFGCVNNSWRVITNAPLTIASDTTHRLKVHAAGSHLRIYLNGSEQPVVDVRDSTFSSGMVGVRNFCTDRDRSISSFSNVVVTELPSGSGRVSHP